jgi:hypothetical protein
LGRIEPFNLLKTVWPDKGFFLWCLLRAQFDAAQQYKVLLQKLSGFKLKVNNLNRPFAIQTV